MKQTLSRTLLLRIQHAPLLRQPLVLEDQLHVLLAVLLEGAHPHTVANHRIMHHAVHTSPIRHTLYLKFTDEECPVQ